MISIRTEGNPFKSGLNLQAGGGKRYPYVSAHWVAVDFNTYVVNRWSLRLRFRRWPFLVAEKISYNFMDEWFKNKDAVPIEKNAYEVMLALKKEHDREIARQKRSSIAYAEKCKETGPDYSKMNRWNVFPQPPFN
jgi:hypothetical protein